MAKKISDSKEISQARMEPILHEIECLCGENFPVFSLIETPKPPSTEDIELPDKRGKEPKLENIRLDDVEDIFHDTVVQCEDCGLFHHVVEVCESNISKRLPKGKMLWSFSDEELPPALEQAMDAYDVPAAKKAYMAWSVKHGRLENSITLFSEVHSDGQIRGRELRFTPEGKARVTPFVSRTVVMPELNE